MTESALLEIQFSNSSARPLPGDRSWNCSRGGPSVLLRTLETRLRPVAEPQVVICCDGPATAPVLDGCLARLGLPTMGVTPC